MVDLGSHAGLVFTDDSMDEEPTKASMGFEILLKKLAKEHLKGLRRATWELRKQNADLVAEREVLRRRVADEYLAPLAPGRQLFMDPIHFTTHEETLNERGTASTAVANLDHPHSVLPISKGENSEVISMPPRLPLQKANGITLSKRVSEDDDDDSGIQILGVWKNQYSVRNSFSLRRTSRLISSSGLPSLTSFSDFRQKSTESIDSDELQSKMCRCLNAFVVSPTSTKRLVWDLIGLCLLFNDMVMIPIQTFAPPVSDYSTVMTWITLLYWTMDIPAGFFVGHYRKGFVEKRLKKIASHYAKSWLPIDTGIVCLDWGLAVMGLLSSAQNSGGWRLAKVGKTAKFLRLIRFMRLLKAAGIVSELLERINSEYVLILMGVFKLLVLILLLNHFIACIFYGIGNMHGAGDTPSWVEKNHLGIDDRTFGYRYLTSLHWSITQFTPASMEVVPENALERGFTVMVILFAMVIFSCLVSSITNAMTKLTSLNKDFDERFTKLRQYMAENDVNKAVMMKVFACVQESHKHHKHLVHEQDVKLISDLPCSLKIELLEQVYAPVLMSHHFFFQMYESHGVSMRGLFQNSFEGMAVYKGKELFDFGDEAEKMYFFVSGTFLYREENQPMPKALSPPYCFSEAVLWVSWSHMGKMMATTQCELVALKANRMQDFFSQNAYIAGPCKAYAEAFASYFIGQPDFLNDIWADADQIKKMTRLAFFGEVSDVDETESSIQSDSPLPLSFGQKLSAEASKFSRQVSEEAASFVRQISGKKDKATTQSQSKWSSSSPRSKGSSSSPRASRPRMPSQVNGLEIDPLDNFDATKQDDALSRCSDSPRKIEHVC